MLAEAGVMREIPHLFDRFDSFYIPEPMSGCWIWIGGDNGNDYGVFSLKHGYTIYAHRFSYLVHKGDIPDGLELDHTCRNRLCVNPDHLEAVTHQVNKIRGMKTHCKYGHALTEDNLYYDPGGRRYCIVCIRRHQKERPRRIRVNGRKVNA